MNRSSEQKQIFTGIDVCKLIAAILVVLLHTVETSEFYSGEIKFVFTRFAVPFFFITSGYFFCKGLDKAENRRKYFFKYELNLIKIFTVWALIIYLPFTVHSYIQNNPDAGTIKLILLLIRRVFIIGPGPYWYLIALMWSIAFIFVCSEKTGDILLLSAMVIGFILEIAYTCFNGVLSNLLFFRYLFNIIYTVYSWEFNFIMFGIPFAGIGYFICKKGFSVTLRSSCVIFGVCTVMRMIEYNLPLLIKSSFWDSNCISLAFIPQAVAFFMIAKEWAPKLSKEQSLTVRQASSFIYFFHLILLYEIIDIIVPKIVPWNIFSPEWIVPKWIFVVVVCLILFYIIKKINNKHLNILING